MPIGGGDGDGAAWNPDQAFWTVEGLILTSVVGQDGSAAQPKDFVWSCPCYSIANSSFSRLSPIKLHDRLYHLGLLVSAEYGLKRRIFGMSRELEPKRGTYTDTQDVEEVRSSNGIQHEAADHSPHQPILEARTLKRVAMFGG